VEGTIHLEKRFFTEQKYRLFDSAAFSAAAWKFDSGIDALTLGNQRGFITILPFMGQMIWDAVFDGRNLTMKNMFSQPLPAGEIIETYGCYLFHSGMLRNGCPGPEDKHLLHGEMPCAPLGKADLVYGEKNGREFLRLEGRYEYVMGFGNHYLAQPSIELAPDSGVFEVTMSIKNLGGENMELMYMCHINPLFEKGAKLIQPMSYTPENVVTRISVPDHVRPTPEWQAFLQDVAAHPEKMSILDAPKNYNPEFVFFLKNLAADQNNLTHFLMKLKDGSGCYCSYSLKEFDHAVRWILANPDQSVAAFALPATCEPEGYTAEKAKGNIKTLKPGETRSFTVQTGYLSAAECLAKETLINAL